MAEFSYNNGYRERIKLTRCFANSGSNPEYQPIRNQMKGKIMVPQEMSYLRNILQAEMMEGQLGY